MTDPESMPDPNSPELSQLSEEEKTRLAGTERRIWRVAWIIASAAFVLCWLTGGWRRAAGFAIGAALSAVNFRWMRAAVNAVSDLATSQPGGTVQKPETSGVVFRGVLRYALIGVVAYAIFKSSLVSLGAFFAGLFLLIAAIVTEAGCEVFAAFRK